MQKDANLLENVANEISGVDQTKYDNLKRLYYAEAAQKEKFLNENKEISMKLRLLEDKLAEVRKKEEKLETQIMQNNERDLENINKFTELKQNTDKKIQELEKENEHFKERLNMIEVQNAKELEELKDEKDQLLETLKEKELQINEFKQKTEKL